MLLTLFRVVLFTVILIINIEHRQNKDRTKIDEARIPYLDISNVIRQSLKFINHKEMIFCVFNISMFLYEFKDSH